MRIATGCHMKNRARHALLKDGTHGSGWCSWGREGGEVALQQILCVPLLAAFKRGWSFSEGRLAFARGWAFCQQLERGWAIGGSSSSSRPNGRPRFL
eukprot:5614548-Pleurochrysis_carterae.AAC.3